MFLINLFYSNDYIFPYSRKKNTPQNVQEDARQQARFGVIEALEGYDPSKGLFMSYVKYHVRNRLNRDRTNSWINVPVYVRDVVSKVNKLEGDYILSKGRLPNDSEILEELDISPQMLSKVRKVQDLSYEEVLEDTDVYYEPEHTIKLDVELALEKLSEPQKAVINLYFFNQKSIRDIAEELGYPVNKVYSILNEAKAILAELLEGYK